VSRRYENDVTREAFRTLQANPRQRPAPVFRFLEVADEEEASVDKIDLAGLAKRERS
jgi:hypothetical protein